MAHSPAPWKSDRCCVLDAEGKPVAIVHWPLDDGDMMDANVKLVTTAPDLAAYARRRAEAGDTEAAGIVAVLEGGDGTGR
jgi:hypothetical protein